MLTTCALKFVQICLATLSRWIVNRRENDRDLLLHVPLLTCLFRNVRKCVKEGMKEKAYGTKMKQLSREMHCIQ